MPAAPLIPFLAFTGFDLILPLSVVEGDTAL